MFSQIGEPREPREPREAVYFCPMNIKCMKIAGTLKGLK